MALKTLANNISFNELCNQVLFTAVALELAAEDDDKEVAGLALPLNKILTRWEELNRDRQSQQRAAVRASALCRRGDFGLDAALTAVHNATLAEVEQERKAPLFTHLFPKPLSTLTRPALENQLKIVAAFVERFKTSDAPATLRKAHDKPLQKSLEQGEAANKQRLVTRAAATVLATRVDALRDDANAALLHVDGALKQLAAKRRLGKSWVDSFFPEGVSKPKKKAAEPPATAAAAH